MLIDSPGELEADFQEFYRLNLSWLLEQGEYRQANVLTRQLPQRSRVFSKINPSCSWSTEDYLLALIADNLAFMRYEQSSGKHRKKPKPVERPKKPKQQKRGHTVHGKSKDQIWKILSAPRHS